MVLGRRRPCGIIPSLSVELAGSSCPESDRGGTVIVSHVRSVKPSSNGKRQTVTYRMNPVYLSIKHGGRDGQNKAMGATKNHNSEETALEYVDQTPTIWRMLETNMKETFNAVSSPEVFFGVQASTTNHNRGCGSSSTVSNQKQTATDMNQGYSKTDGGDAAFFNDLYKSFTFFTQLMEDSFDIFLAYPTLPALITASNGGGNDDNSIITSTAR